MSDKKIILRGCTSMETANKKAVDKQIKELVKELEACFNEFIDCFQTEVKKLNERLDSVSERFEMEKDEMLELIKKIGRNIK
jgi:peptidoglycan hydrolase CwlO-like protein